MLCVHPVSAVPTSAAPLKTMNSIKLLFAMTALFCGHALAAEIKPLQVFILAGQSNMQGHAQVRTFEHIGMDPATKPLLAEMLGADGKPKVCERVWISSIGCAEAMAGLRRAK